MGMHMNHVGQLAAICHAQMLGCSAAGLVDPDPCQSNQTAAQKALSGNFAWPRCANARVGRQLTGTPYAADEAKNCQKVTYATKQHDNDLAVWIRPNTDF